jgi:hypothetical protein
MKCVARIVFAIVLFVTHGAAPAFGLSLKEYFELKKKSALMIEWYLSGLVDGYTLANTWVPTDQRIFCIPGKLALQSSNLQQLTEEYYDKQTDDFKREHFEESFSFEVMAMMALVNTFPCKTIPTPKDKPLQSR